MKACSISSPKIAKLAAYAALGPITGPLTAGIFRSLRNDDRMLAALYAAAIPAAYGLLGLVSTWTLSALPPI
jgi:hypothetical protein